MPVPTRSAALTIAMAALQKKLSVSDYARFDQALSQSETLTTRLNEQVGHSITSIDYRSGFDGARFEPNRFGVGPIAIGDKYLADLVSRPGPATNDIIFLLGHEAWHGENSASVLLRDGQLINGSFGPNATVITKASVNYNATQFVKSYVQSRMQDEALGNIRGWNDVVNSEMNRVNGGAPLTTGQLQNLFLTSGYSRFFLNSNGTYRNGFSSGALSAGMVDPSVIGNVTLAIADQGIRSPAGLDMTYYQYYSAYAIDLSAALAKGRPVILDFGDANLLKDNAGISITWDRALEALITAGLDGNGAPKFVIQDSAAHAEYSITRTASGLTIQSTTAPDPTAAGTLNVPIAAPVTVVVTPNQPTIVERWIEELGTIHTITGAQIGGILGSTLGRQIAGNDPFAQLASGTVLGAIGQALGRAIDTAGHTQTTLTKALSVELNNLPSAVRDVGVGAISSALVAEFGNAIGLSGDVAGVFNATAGSYVAQIATNIVQNGFASAFANLGSINPIAIVGAYFGSKLAMSIGNFDTIGGQIGASIGSAIGSIILPGFIGGFIGTLAGGLIGSLFGGIPRSGADVVWDQETQRFEVANAYTRKGGSKSAAISMADTVASAYNNVLSAVGGQLINPESVAAGNYGMRKSDYVYRPTSTTDRDAITARFNGRNGALDLINFGARSGLQDMTARLAGGSVYAKRALSATVQLALRPPNASGTANGGTFDLPTLAGNLQIASDYGDYLLNSSAIGALIAAEPNSEFTAAWTVTLARALDLGLNKRAKSDWTGGFSLWLDERADGAIDGKGLAPSAVTPVYHVLTSERVWGVTGSLGGDVAVFADTIQAGDKTVIIGTAQDDVLSITGDMLTLVNDLTVDGAVQTSGTSPFKIDVAAVIDGGQGNDTIYTGDLGNDAFGGLGNDTLIGGKLDDWLIGGDGNDKLYAGAVADGSVTVTTALGADGGSGNYLDGGAGDDALYGSAGSDWLAGGDGVDLLYGGAGGDILNAGAGNEGAVATPAVQGGGGSDQYVFNRGDGQDVYYDDATGALPGATSDSIGTATRARTANTLAKNWAGGGEYLADGSTKGGEDAISFSPDITMKDILLQRSGTVTSPGMDLIIKVQRADGSWVAGDDQIVVRDWFEGTRKIEWLRFANGEELRIGDFVTFKLGTAGADVIVGTAGNDFLYGGDGNDRMFGLAGNDFAAGGRGNDLVSGNDDNDIVIGGGDDDVVLGGLGNDTVSGDDGADRVYGGGSDDIVSGGHGDDELVGGSGNDVFRFERGDGRDTLFDEFAGTWELVWQGGAYVNGYSVDGYGVVTKGGVTYNDGVNWIGHYDYNEQGAYKTLFRLVPPSSGSTVVNSGTDTLEFGVGIDIQDVVFRQEGNDLRIAITRSGFSIDNFDETVDQIRVRDWYLAAPAGKSIENFQFVNTGAQLASAMNLVGGTDGSDTITAVAGTAAWVTGGAGDDTITGTALADILNGSSGADTLTGAGGADVLFGGDGDDILIGGAAADVIVGGSGSDTASYAGSAALTVFLDSAQGTSTGDAVGDVFTSIENLTGSSNADILYGDVGSNVLDGGAGTANDTLYGNAGDDIYLLNANSGTDTVTDRLMSGTTVVAGAAGDDTIEVGTGLSLSSLTFVKVSNNLEIRIGTSTVNKLVLTNFYLTPDAKIETLVLADGLLANLANIRIGTEVASADADLLAGTASADTLSGLAGNDVLSGGAGNDTLNGGDGDDVLEGGAGSDTLNGGLDTISSGGVASADGNGDTIRYAASAGSVSVNLAMRSVSGGTSSDAIGDVIVADGGGVSTIENVSGSAFADTLTGDSRANMLIGLAGTDTLSGAAGDDVLLGGDDADVISGGDGNDNIDAGEGNDINVHGDLGNDLIAGSGGDDTLYGDAGTDRLDGGLGNDTLWGGADADTLGGGDGNDVLNGDAGDDKLAGGAGNDTLNGGDGNDTFSGDLGDDSLAGGLGDDVYAFDANSGADTIVDASGANRILIAGVMQDQLWLTRAGSDLKISVIGGTTRITVTGYFAVSTPTLVREIATSGSSIFLKYAGGQTYAGSLIEAMTLANAAVPAAITDIPTAVAATRDAIWWQGGKAPPIVANQALVTAEDTVLGGTLAVTDHDENVSAFSVATQAAHGSVIVNATTGAWTYTPTANYFGADSFILSVNDADNQAANATISLTIASVNDAPAWGLPPVLAVDENSANGLVIATLAATDVDGDAVVYSVTDVNSPFAISAGGVLSVRDGALLNFEANCSRTVSVRATDGIASADQLFTVTVRNVAEAPNTPALSAGSVPIVSEPAEGAPAIGGTTIATFAPTDPDGTVPTLRLRAGSAAMFDISGNTLKFNAAYTPDFEVLAVQPGAVLVDRDSDGLKEVEFSADVESWDGGLASAGAARVTIGIEDINEAPTAINFTSPWINERDHPMIGAPTAAISLGLLTGLDPDLAIAGETLIYSTSNPQFEIVNGNELRLKAGEALDFESAATESSGRVFNRYIDVAITVSDRAGGTGTKSLTLNKRIYINDVTDYYYGTLSADTLTGGVGTDWLYGSDGNDTLSGAIGNDTLYGEVGNDTLNGGDHNDALFGGVGDDFLNGDDGDDILSGDDGIDILSGGSGWDQLNGGTGNDSLFGGDQADTLRGDDGDDYLDGGSDIAADALYGGAGNDTLLGGAGNDTLDGGSDNDLINGGAGGDTIIGGSGTDTVTYVTSSAAVSVNLGSGAHSGADAQGDTLTGIENVIGSTSADTIVGDASSNWLEGGDGGDWLQGEAGDDGLLGQNGNDTLYGMDGADQLDGGAGNDTLYGGNDNDVLVGGLGDDLLLGGVGDDRYTFQRGDGADIVDQAGSLVTDSDIVGFTNVNRDNLWFKTVGTDIQIGLLGTSALDSSVTLKSFLTADVDQRAQIRVVIAQTDATIDLKLGELTGKLDRFATALGYPITTQTQFDSLKNNTSLLIDGLTFSQTWNNYWTSNAPAVFTPGAASLAVSEDQYIASPYNFSFTLADDYDSPTQLLERTVTAVVSSGSTAASNALLNVSVTWPATNGGSGTIAVRTQPNASGTGYVWVHTKDTGGLVSDSWIPVSVAAIADAPTVSGSSPGGNAGTGIAINIAPQLIDTDGSESARIVVSAVPASFTFSNTSGSVSVGNNRQANGSWSFSASDLTGLRLNVPVGWSQNLTGASALQVTAIATEASNGSTASSAPFALPLVINAAPAAPALTNSTINENVAPGTIVGMLVANDPDRLENNPFDYASSYFYPNESRWISNTPGPLGGSVTALQTGQFDTGNGGGVHSNQFTIDPTKAYKFTVYVRADSTGDAQVYFGVQSTNPASVENATTGADDTDPYFTPIYQSMLTVGQWYRLEGYVLPRGAPLVEASAYGGVFNVATGAKVADAKVFRWNDTMTSTSMLTRFYNFNGSPQGFSTSWYEPVVEQLPTFTKTGGAGLTVDGATGLVRVSASPNYEAASNLPLSVTVTDAGGLQSTANLNVLVNNINETPVITSGTGWAHFTETGFGYRPANANVTVATIGVADPDNTVPTLEFAPGGNPGNWFYIDQASKQVRFNPGVNFNYEAFRNAGTYGIADYNGNGILEAYVANVYVRASDGSLLSNDGLVQVFIEDSPEPPVNLRADRSLAIPENQGAGGFAWMQADDPEGGPLTYTIADGLNGGGHFSLRSDGLLSSDGSFDYETATSFTIRVQATDPTGGPTGTTTQDFTIPITNVNERPNNLIIEAQNFFPETQGSASHAGLLIARFTMADPDGAAPGLVILGGNDYGWFQTVSGNHLAFSAGVNFSAAWLHANIGTLGVDSGYYYDNNGNGLLEVRVATLTLAAQDANGLRSDPFTYSVFIEDANEAPTITSSSFAVNENMPGAGNTIVGTVAWSDPDASSAFRNPSFSILGGNTNSTFSINAANGQIALQGSLNYETTPFYDLTVGITDAGGLSSSRVVRVNVGDVNEAPNPTVNAAKTQVYANDPDANDPVTFSLTTIYRESGGGTYQINPTTGVISWPSVSTSWRYIDEFMAHVVDSRGAASDIYFTIVRNPNKPSQPIVLDLDGDGIELITLAQSATYFDMDGDGLRDRTGWANGDDGQLVLDRNRNGTIDDINEISFINDYAGARSDLEGLRAFDTNGDGVFGLGDRQFGEFQVWQDRNQDGVSQASELSSLAQRGIDSITLELDETGAKVEGATDNVLFATSEFTRRNGSTGDVGDVFFAFKSAVDVDKKGELKPGKKIKFSGLDDTNALPDKLKDASLSTTTTTALDSTTALAGSPHDQTAGVMQPQARQGMQQAAAISPKLDETDSAAGTRDGESSLRDSGAYQQPSPTEADRSDPAKSETVIPLVQDVSAARYSEDLALSAADTLRRPQSISLNTGIREAYGTAASSPVTYSIGDGKLDRLIAAMAAFQGGEGIGDLTLASAPQIDNVIAQLASAA